MAIIAPSLLSANFLQLQHDCDMLNLSPAQWYHLDVMDGSFVPNISFGPMFVQFFKQATTKVLDVHLMIVQPERYIQDFATAGANNITIHYEACTHLHRTLQQIKAAGCKAGIAINPHTPVHLLTDVIHEAQLVCIMSVNPGFGGQAFIPNTYHKIKQLKALITAANATTLIQVDGGVTLENASLLLQAGADVLVAGNAIFKATNPTQTIAQFCAL